MTEQQKILIDKLMGMYGAKHFAPMYEGDSNKVMMGIHVLEAYTNNVIDEVLYKKTPMDDTKKNALAESLVNRFVSDCFMFIPSDDVKKMLEITLVVLKEYNI